jgi:hypothetical protein
VEDIRETLNVSLQLLADFAFSNRVIFFNNVDKAQVMCDSLASWCILPDPSCSHACLGA